MNSSYSKSSNWGLSGDTERALEEIGRDFGMRLNDQSRTYIVVAHVEAVNEDAKTMDAIMSDGNTIPGISLDIVQGGNNSVLVIPAIESVVILGFVEGLPERAVPLCFTTIEKTIIRNLGSNNETNSQIVVENDEISIQRGQTLLQINDNNVRINSNLVQINGGNNGGLVLSTALSSAFNTLINTYNAHTHPVSGTTAGPTTQQATTTTATQFENNKITQ